MIKYIVNHPTNGTFFFVEFDSPAIDAAWREVVKALPDYDWTTLCKRLYVVTDRRPKWMSRNDCLTGLDPCGAYAVQLSPKLARMPTKFQKGAIAHELAHVVKDHGRSAKSADAELDTLREEYQADKVAWDWGFQIDGLARHVNFMLRAGTLPAQYR